MTALDALVYGKNRILKYGWTQGQAGNNQEGYDIYGAMEESSPIEDPAFSDAVFALKGVFVGFHSKEAHFVELTRYNDNPNTSKKDILNLYDEAITYVLTPPTKTKRK